MALSRLPRFKRITTVIPIQLTNRDRQIVQLVHQHRFLRSSHITALLGGSSQQLLRRLQLLYHHGYLERPRAQIEYYGRGGSRHMVYGLGNKGARLLEQEFGIPVGKVRWSEKNRAAGRVFLEHALAVSEVMVGLELACRATTGLCLGTSDDLQSPSSAKIPHPLKWRVQVNGRLKLGIIPDRVFALDRNRPDGSSNPVWFFLEVDRGTMPIVRRNLVQSSFYRKLLAYEATWAQGLHHSLFGFHRFRVLSVTTSAARVKSLVEACSQLKRGHGLFLFVDRATLEQHGNILTVPCQTGRPGETSTLLT